MSENIDRLIKRRIESVEELLRSEFARYLNENEQLLTWKGMYPHLEHLEILERMRSGRWTRQNSWMTPKLSFGVSVLSLVVATLSLFVKCGGG